MAKQFTVNKVFNTVATKYDLMNDLMSFGIHRLWKKQFVDEMQPHHNQKLLDVAGGTGDIATKFLDAGGGKAVICDINRNMLKTGMLNRIDSGDHKKYARSIEVVCANAQNLPFDNNIFERVTISFGIRNVELIQQALNEMYRVLKPTGKFLCLEFTNHEGSGLAKSMYDLYLKWLPKLGRIIVGDSNPYEYLSDSIKQFPKKNEFLNMLQDAGFVKLNHYNVFPPVATIYVGYKTHY